MLAQGFSRKIIISIPESVSSSLSSMSGSDEVSVYCRLRPLPGGGLEEASVRPVDDRTVRLVPPETSRAFNSGKQTQYSFKKVFDGESANADVFGGVALPLVKDLLQVWSLSSFKVSRQPLMYDLNRVSSVSLIMTASTALANEGLFELFEPFVDTGTLLILKF